MAYLHQIIDDHAILDDRVLKRASIDGRISANLNVVANIHRSELLNLDPTLRCGRKPKTIGTNRRIRMNRAARADFYRVTNHRTRLDHRIVTNLCTLTHESARTNPYSVAERHVLLDMGTSIYRDSHTQLGCV